MGNFLFSTNTWLSYILAERFYAGRHFVWCTPYFEIKSQTGFDVTTPPTSTPKEIYQALALEVERNDKHSSKIKDNRANLLKGAKVRFNRGDITLQDLDRIRAIVNSSSVPDYQPLLYIINYEAVKTDLIEVPIAELAHPLSVEYRLENLVRDHFEV